MDPQIRQFKGSARKAINDKNLQSALAKLSSGFPARRQQATARLPEFESLRDEARTCECTCVWLKCELSCTWERTARVYTSCCVPGRGACACGYRH